MSKTTKTLWLLVISYIILCCILGFLKINNLGLIMADNLPIVIISAIGIQFLIYIFNSFMSGLKD
jgi:hypothetical protein